MLWFTVMLYRGRHISKRGTDQQFRNRTKGPRVLRSKPYKHETVNQSMWKMARYSDPRQATEPTWSPENSNAFLTSGRWKVLQISLCPHSTAGTSHYQDRATLDQVCACTEDTRKHHPLLGKASRKISIRILRTSLLGSKCHLVEACSHSEPCKQVTAS